eukprot:PhF_6_TR5164/c0_g1_i1/m.7396
MSALNQSDSDLTEMLIRREEMKAELQSVVEENVSHFEYLRNIITMHKRDAEDAMKSQAMMQRMSQVLLTQLQGELESVEKLKRQRAQEKVPAMETMEDVNRRLTRHINSLKSGLEKKRLSLEKYENVIEMKRVILQKCAEEDDKRHRRALSVNDTTIQSPMASSTPVVGGGGGSTVVRATQTPPGSELGTWLQRLHERELEEEERRYGISRRVMKNVAALQEKIENKKKEDDENLFQSVETLLAKQEMRRERMVRNLEAMKTMGPPGQPAEANSGDS